MKERKEIYLYEFNEERRDESKPKILISNDLDILAKAESGYKILVSEYPNYLKSIAGLDIYVACSKEEAETVAEFLYNF